MTLKEFIRQHRAALDGYIAEALGLNENPRANDEERESWVLNDEGLYDWARSEEVGI